MYSFGNLKRVKHSIRVFLLLILGNIQSWGQGADKVQLLHANSLEFDLQATGKVKRLIGDVRFKQNNTLLFCDSAYQYDELNKVEAFGNVRINHQDSVLLYGKQLTYEGDGRIARLKGNARLVERDLTVSSEALDFDLNRNIGFYANGGKITSGQSTLTSRNGYYYSTSKQTFFKKDVVLIQPDYAVYTDTLEYGTVSRMAYFLAPTRILGGGDRLYCLRGQYDTEKQLAWFTRGAAVFSGNNILYADSLYYDRTKQFGRAFSGIELYDTIEQVVVYGDYGEMSGRTRQSIVTRNAVAKQYMDKDSMYVFADTIQTFRRINNSFLIKATGRVKMIKSDMQARCDSMVYDQQDSMISLYDDPVLWSGVNQITADTMFMLIRNHYPDSFIARSNSFVISREAALLFDQIKGRHMYGRFENNLIRYLFVDGNCQSIYYAKEDSAFTGVNVSNCSEMEFYFEQGRMNRANFIGKPESTFYPMKELKPEELKLKKFKWRNQERPRESLILKRFSDQGNFLKKTLWNTLIYE